mgnify:CR=1 FL=1
MSARFPVSRPRRLRRTQALRNLVAETRLDVNDLVAMFAGGACVGGNVDPCVPTAEAAAWARMVNQARASGHCEGLGVQAASRFASSVDWLVY